MQEPMILDWIPVRAKSQMYCNSIVLINRGHLYGHTARAVRACARAATLRRRVGATDMATMATPVLTQPPLLLLLLLPLLLPPPLLLLLLLPLLLPPPPPLLLLLLPLLLPPPLPLLLLPLPLLLPPPLRQWLLLPPPVLPYGPWCCSRFSCFCCCYCQGGCCKCCC